MQTRTAVRAIVAGFAVGAVVCTAGVGAGATNHAGATPTSQAPGGGAAVVAVGSGVGVSAGAQPVKVEGHRGGPALGAPASSAKLIRRAVAAGVPRVELDVFFTRDKVAVINHSDTIEDARAFTTAGGTRVPARNCSHDGRAIHAMTYAQVRRVRCAGEPLVTLARAMAILKGSGTSMNLEVKARSATEPAGSKRDSARRAVTQAVKAGMTDQMVVSTFSWREMAPVIRSVSTDVYLIGFLPVRDVRQPTAAMYRNVRQAAAAGVDAVGLDADYAPVQFLDFIRAIGMDLYLYDLTTTAKLRFVVSNGQRWVGNDDPRAARRLLDRLAASGSKVRLRRTRLPAHTVYQGALRPSQRAHPRIIGGSGLAPAAAQARLHSIRVRVTIRAAAPSGYLELAANNSRLDRDGVLIPIVGGTNTRVVEVSPGDYGRLRLRATGAIRMVTVTVLGYTNVR